MKHNFLNWTGAVLYMQSCTNPAVYGAISLLHQGIMSCSGVSNSATRFRILPKTALDLLWFYKAVSSIVVNWNNEPNLGAYPNYVDIAPHLLPALKEPDLISMAYFSKEMRKFSYDNEVDYAFCTWVFAETILSRDLLSKVLSGIVGNSIWASENASYDEWAESW